MSSTTKQSEVRSLLNEIEKIVGESRRVLVASHIDPDGDSLGTQLAFAAYLRSIEKEVFLVRDASIPDKYAFLPGVDEVPLTSDECIGGLDFDTAVILECPDPKRIGRAERCIGPDVRVINIDHHLDNGMFGEVNWINSAASSVGEMVYEYFLHVGHKVDQDTAVQLYAAMMTDTGRFRFKSTSARTMQIAGDLIAAGVNPQEVTDRVYFCMRPESMKLTGKVLNSIEYRLDGRVCVLRMTAKMLSDAGAEPSDAEGIVDYTLFSKGVLAGLFVREQADGTIKGSLRSRDGINVASIAKIYGGGGHFNAAGCTLEMGIDEAVEALLEHFEELLKDA